MKHCCEGKAEALGRLRERQGRTLKLVLTVNATMFLVEVTAGLLGRSTALLGDALDMLGDAAVYGVTLYALDRDAIWRAKASLVKGLVMMLFGVGVLAEAGMKSVELVVPHAETMGGIGFLALTANVGCLVLLIRHRRDDVNMRSAWTCSRNDIIANVAVLGAALGVRLSNSWWPDALVGAAIALLFLVSGVAVMRDGSKAFRDHARHQHPIGERSMT